MWERILPLPSASTTHAYDLLLANGRNYGNVDQFMAWIRREHVRLYYHRGGSYELILGIAPGQQPDSPFRLVGIGWTGEYAHAALQEAVITVAAIVRHAQVSSVSLSVLKLPP